MESGFLRGAGVTYVFKSIEITPFYSRNKYDGQLKKMIDSLDLEEISVLSSLGYDGLHRNTKELSEKGKITDETLGGNVSYKNSTSTFRAGLTAINTRYMDSSGANVEIKKTPSKYNQFEFNGNRNTVYGGDYSWNWRNFNFFGEFAQSASDGKSQGIGWLSGLVGSLSKEIEINKDVKNILNLKNSIFII